MRCGHQHRRYRKHVRFCLAPNGVVQGLCRYRGREQFCPRYQIEHRTTEGPCELGWQFSDLARAEYA